MLAVWIIRAAIVALAVAASVTDIRTRRVPDWLTLPPVALGLAAFAWRLHWVGVGLWAAGAGGMALLLAVPWLLGGLGGGDFKMMLALGALGGPIFGVQALAMGLVVGLQMFAVCGLIGAVRAWGDAGRAGVGAHWGAVAPWAGRQPRGSRRPARLRTAVAAGWRTLHDAPPPFAVALDRFQVMPAHIDSHDPLAVLLSPGRGRRDAQRAVPPPRPQRRGSLAAPQSRVGLRASVARHSWRAGASRTMRRRHSRWPWGHGRWRRWRA